MTLDEYFSGWEQSRQIFDALGRLIAGIGPSEIRVTRSQVAFRRRKAFAWAWIPAMYLRGNLAPLVLTVALRRRDPSDRWKQVVEPAAGRYTHHLELRSVDDMDDQVRDWLREAWGEAS